MENSKITVFNLLSVIGLALLLVACYLGRLYVSGGEMAADVLFAVGATAVTTLVLWFLVKAKCVKNNLAKWRNIEIATLFIYIIVAAAIAWFSGVMKFCSVTGNRAEVKEIVEADVNGMHDALQQYRSFTARALSATETGLLNAVETGYPRSEQLADFMDNNHIDDNVESVRNYIDILRNQLMPVSLDNFESNLQDRCNAIKSVVDSWSFLRVPAQVKEMTFLTGEVSAEINRLADLSARKLPIVQLEDTEFVIGSYQRTEYVLPDSANLENAIKGAPDFSILGVIAMIIINILILCYYFGAKRTTVLSVPRGYDSGHTL